MSEIEVNTVTLQFMKHPSRGGVVAIAPEIISGDLEFHSEP